MADLIIMKKDAADEEIKRVVEKIEKLGFKAHVSKGEERTIIGIIGDTRELSDEVFRLLPGVSEVISILKEYKLASREFHKEDTVIEVDGIKIGEGYFVIMAGPCSVENKEQLLTTGKFIKQLGAKILRGAIFKPRTSPYSFLGLGKEGLNILKEVKEELKIPIITEVLSPEEVDIVSDVSDILQIGTRNMFNYRLLQKVGKIDKPVLLKRNFSAKISEFLNCAEYILKEGNNKVILCERGIRTFDSEFTRNTLDLSAVPILKKETYLPVIVDPSHGTGRRDLIIPMSKAAVAVGADGLLIEVHPKPEEALSDGFQSITFDMFENLMRELEPFIKIMKKKV
jgi:3-deoxy-7-phosphoheptulonate synthase